MKTHRMLVVTMVLYALSVWPAVVLSAQEDTGRKPLFKQRMEERQQKRQERRQDRRDRAEELRNSLQALAETSQAAIEEREQLKNDLATGKGVNTNKKIVSLTLPFVSKQHDGWSCGLHTAARLLKYNNYEVSYDNLRKQRKLTTLQYDSDKGPYTLPPTLQQILRRWHPKSWWMTDVQLDVIKNLLRQKKPVAALVAIPDSTYTIKIADQKIKAPATHWVVISGFNDATKSLQYYDPLKKGVQRVSYDDFMKVWATSPEEFAGGALNPLLLTYGFMATRTVAFCN